jgi:hypothetical protein
VAIGGVVMGFELDLLGCRLGGMVGLCMWVGLRVCVVLCGVTVLFGCACGLCCVGSPSCLALRVAWAVYFTLPPLFRQIPMDFHWTQPIPMDPVDSLSDFQWILSDLTKFRCLSGPSPVKVR